MSIFNKIKKGIEHAVSEGAGEVKKVIDGGYDAQKDIIGEVKKQAENLITDAYTLQKQILKEASDEAGKIIEDAYVEQKRLIKEAQDKAIVVGSSELYDIIVKTFENGNPLMKIIGMVLKSFRKQILDAIQNELK